jgi:hypothetical protein
MTEARPGPRRVAVIGVHGVAHHDPGATANAMADLLLSLPPYDPKKADIPCAQRPEHEFDQFRSVGIHVPLQPVCLEGAEKNQPEYKAAFGWLQEGSAKFARAISEKKLGKERGQIGRKWSVALLQGYHGGAMGNDYITTRLEGQRKRDGTEVHIYEMFWADLARPTSSVLSFLLALFQLILHIPSLSRLAIDSRPDGDRSWKTFQFLHRYAARMLQIFIPLAKVALLVVLLSAVPNVMQKNSQMPVAAGLGAAIVAGFVLFAMMIKHWPLFRSRLPWLAFCLIPGLIAAGVVVSYKGDILTTLIVESWIIGLLLVLYVLAAYDSVRSGGVWWIGLVFYFVVLVLFATYTWRYDVARANLWTAQWILFSLRVSWIIFALLAIAAAVGGIVAYLQTPVASRGKARAAARTSFLALALPAFLFVFITTFIWAGLFSVAEKIRGDQPFFSDTKPAPQAQWLADIASFDLFPPTDVKKTWDCGQDPNKKSDNPARCSERQKVCPYCTAPPPKPNYLAEVLSWSVGPGSWVTTLITLAGLIVLVWWAVPSVLTEKFPARRRYSRGETEPPRSSTNRESEWMGSWTSRGLDSTSFVTLLSWVAIFIVPLIFLHSWQWRQPFEDTTRKIICLLIYVAGVAAMLAAIVRYSSPVLRVILDVDTYLRTHPDEGTPRAKIFERYVSLLRYTARFKGQDGRGYDGVVIVAHSLGSLISGDLLNLLNHQKNDLELSRFGFGPPGPEEPPLPITLFTMGNPLRQLLNRFFPYLYDWVRENPDNGDAQLGSPLREPPKELDSTPGTALLPDPTDLGIQKWANAYRSGDYVGRSLWLNEWYRRTRGSDDNGTYPDPIEVVTDRAGARIEFCIGAGAHTHYWDDTAPDIAQALDRLI